MKNSEDHIDKLFRDNLGNQSFDIPTEFIDSLNNQLDQLMPVKERKSRIIYITLSSLFLLFFLFISICSQPINNNFNRLESTKENAIENLKKSEINNTSKSSIQNQSIKLKPSDNNTSDATGHSQYSVLKSDVEKETKYDSNVDLKINKRSINPSIETNKDTSIKPGFFNQNETKNNTIIETKKNKNINQNNNVLEPTSDNDLNHSTFILPPDTLIARDTVVIFDTLKIMDTVVVIDTIFVIDSSLIKIDNSNKWNFELQLFVGGNYGSQRFSSLTESNASYFIEEKPLFTPTFGFNINADYNKINIGTGLEYFQTGEKTTFRFNSTSQVDTIEIVGYNIDSIFFDSTTQSMDTLYIPIYDTTTYFDTITTSENRTNLYSWFSIPINFGYRFDFGKWALIPRFGFTFNVGIRNSEGQYFNTQENNYGVYNVKPAIYNIDYLLQLEIRRSINKFDLFLSPNYRGNVTPMFSNSPTRSYKSIGVRFGAAFKL